MKLILIIFILTIKGYAMFNIEKFNKNNNNGYYNVIDKNGMQIIQMTYKFALHHIPNDDFTYVNNLDDDYSFYHILEKIFIQSNELNNSKYVEIKFLDKDKKNFIITKYNNDAKVVGYTNNSINHSVEMVIYDKDLTSIYYYNKDDYYNLDDVIEYLQQNKDFFLWGSKEFDELGIEKDNDDDMYKKYKNELINMFTLLLNKYKFIPISKNHSLNIIELNNGNKFVLSWLLHKDLINEVTLEIQNDTIKYSNIKYKEKINCTNK